MAFMRSVLNLTRQYRSRLVLGVLCGFIAGLTNPLLMGSIKLVFEVVFPGPGAPTLLERLEGTSLLSPTDVNDLPDLMGKVEHGSNTVAQLVWAQFDPESQRLIGNAAFSDRTRQTIFVEELNKALHGPALDQFLAPTNSWISPATRAFAVSHLDPQSRSYLHLLVLRDAFPEELKASHQQGIPSLLVRLVPGGKARWASLQEGLVARLRSWLQTHRRERSPELTVLVILTIPLAMLLRGLFSYLNVYLMNWVSVRAVADLRARLFTHLMSLSASYFSKVSTGELMSRFSDVHGLHNTISQAMVVIIKEPVTLAGLAVFLLWQQPKLTSVALVIFPIALIPFVVYARKVRKSSVAIYQKYADMGRMMHESFTGFRIVKAYNLEKKVIDEFAATSGAAVSHFMRVLRSMEIPGPLMEFIGAVGVACFFIYIALFSRTTPGGLIVFVGSLFMMYQPIKALIRLHNQLQQAEAATHYAFQILATKSTIVEPASPKRLVAHQADIHFDHISFSYGDKPAVRDLDLTVKAGQMVALVGSSGSGKTTLTNLLLRFYDPQEGAVRVGSVDIREVSLADLRRQIAVVTQESILFNDSIANNIAVGRPEATLKEIVAAAKHAHAHGFIMDKTAGYETLIGEKGVTLSGGQKQRLAIARAILKNAPILILDEATSSLDTESERAIQAALDDLMQQRTTICIAHRLSTIQHADVIVVLHEGRIVETGQHEQLLRQGGIYRRLYELQFQA
jgi:subfamily B ATP-binding cassette protein MsbA